MIYAFTSAAANYVPKLRLLCRSLRRFHPEFRIAVALADRKPGWLEDLSAEPFDEVIPVESLPIPEVRNWIFRHALVELATGLKPFALQSLLARPDCEAVLYFDPDIVLFSKLDDLLQQLRTANIVLTPHQTTPESGYEAVVDNEICSLKHGVYNLGFLGVRNTADTARFAQWWADRLYEFCRADIPAGLFTDQRWIDLVPAFFDGVTILKSPRFNVAPWNLTTRQVRGSIQKGLYVGQEPLGFYHFTGFDSGAHALMAEKNGRGNKTVREMVAWYLRETATGGRGEASKTAWAYGRYANGEVVMPFHRHLYRERRDLRRAYPDPFACDGASYFGWLNTQGPIEYPQQFGAGAAPAETPAPPPARTGIGTIALRALTRRDFRRRYWERCKQGIRAGGISSLLRELKRPML